MGENKKGDFYKMRKLKTILAGVITSGLVLAMSMTAFAASGINSAEQDLIDYGSGKAKALAATPHQVQMVNDYVGQAVSFLNSDGVDLTTNETATLKATVDEAAAAAAGMDLKNMPMDQKKALATQVASIMKVGAAKVGITLQVGTDGSAVAKMAATGKTIATTGITVKATGIPVNTTMAVISTLIVILVGCGIFAKRNRLFE